MAVSDNFRTEVRRFSGYSDPALPIASYIQQGGSIGDGSGALFMNMLFRLGEFQPVIERSQFYNLEQLAIDASGSTGGNVLMRTLNMGQLTSNRPTSPEKWVMSMIPDDVDDSAVGLQDLSGLPIWLDAPNAAGDDAGLRFEFDNVNLRLYAVTTRGYIWGPEAVLAPGGPQRPPNGLFR